VGKLLQKCLWENFLILKTQLLICVLIGDIGRAKQVVPEAERNSIVHSMATRGNILRMVPQMHDRIIQDILQRPIGDLYIGMVQMTNQDGDQVQDEKII
jgi:hypothetical protein